MHHAYLYEGGLSLLQDLKEDAIKRLSLKKEDSKNICVLTHEKFGIEESRILKDMAALKIGEERTLFILGASSITTEAQQALLKLFEEPQEGMQFILLAPKGTVISTLRSRFLPYPAKLEKEIPLKDAKKFLSLPPKLRSAEIAKILKEEEGIKERVQNFLNELESVLHSQVAKNKEARAALYDIAKVRSYANDRSPSLKMLLEHLATALPIVK